MEKDICLHAIYAKSDFYNARATLKILKTILSSNALLSANKQNIKKHQILYNGLDYISLCDYSNAQIYDETSAYENYIRYSLSLMFPKSSLPIIKPQIIPFLGYSYEYFEQMRELGLSKTTRYSDMGDEVQVKDCIPLELMNGITLPIERMSDILLPKEIVTRIILKEIDTIREVLTSYGYQVPLYDIDTFEPLTDEKITKKLIKHYTKRKEI